MTKTEIAGEVVSSLFFLLLMAAMVFGASISDSIDRQIIDNRQITQGE